MPRAYVRARKAAGLDRRIGSPDRIAGSPDRRIAGSPDRRIARSRAYMWAFLASRFENVCQNDSTPSYLFPPF